MLEGERQRYFVPSTNNVMEEFILITYFTGEKRCQNYFIPNQVLYFQLIKHNLLFVNYSYSRELLFQRIKLFSTLAISSILYVP